MDRIEAIHILGRIRNDLENNCQINSKNYPPEEISKIIDFIQHDLLLNYKSSNKRMAECNCSQCIYCIHQPEIESAKWICIEAHTYCCGATIVSPEHFCSYAKLRKDDTIVL